MFGHGSRFKTVKWPTTWYDIHGVLDTPRSCYWGFEGYSFGQKQRPSPFATARLLQVLRRFDDLCDEAAAVDVTALTTSKGGAGTARPPKPQRRERSAR